MLTQNEIFEKLLIILNKNTNLDYDTLLDRHQTMMEFKVSTAVFLENDYKVEGSPTLIAYKQMTMSCLQEAESHLSSILWLSFLDDNNISSVHILRGLLFRSIDLFYIGEDINQRMDRYMRYISNPNFRLSDNYKRPNQWSEHSIIDMIEKGIVEKYRNVYDPKIADQTKERYESLHSACNEVIHGSLTLNAYASEFDGSMVTYCADLEKPVIPNYWDHTVDLYFDVLRGFAFIFDLDTPEKLAANFEQHLERKTRVDS